MTISDFIRKSIRRSVVKEKVKNEKSEELILQISKIGNNLNQIARKCNIEKKVDLEVLRQLKKIQDELKKCL